MPANPSADKPRRTLLDALGLASPVTYVFVVSGLSVFLLGLLAIRTPVSGVVVQAQLARRVIASDGRETPPQADARTIEAMLLDGDALRQAVHEAGLVEPELADVTSLNEAVEAAREQTVITVTPTSSTDVRVKLEYYGHEPGSSRRLVDAVCRQFVEAAAIKAAEQPKRNTPADRADRWRVREARHYERKSLQQLDNFMDDFFRDATQGLQPTVAASSAKREEPNPEFATRKRHLEQLSADRTRLAAKLTANHPQLQELDAEVQLAEDRLLETPEFLAIADEPDAVDTSTNATIGDATIPGEQLLSAAETFRRLRTEHEQTVIARTEAEDSAAEIESNLADKPPVTTVWLMQPAQVTGQLGGGMPAGRMLLLAVFSLAAATIVASLTRRWSVSSAFQSPAEAEQILALPIVADLTEEKESNLSGQPRRRRRA
ncbi:MAG: hypothetical protein KDA62_07490 [Planctomycetales bacterium]|nr:hypothetical protein [Planctomycetales bacterium]